MLRSICFFLATAAITSIGNVIMAASTQRVSLDFSQNTGTFQGGSYVLNLSTPGPHGLGPYTMSSWYDNAEYNPPSSSAHMMHIGGHNAEEVYEIDFLTPPTIGWEFLTENIDRSEYMILQFYAPDDTTLLDPGRWIFTTFDWRSPNDSIPPTWNPATGRLNNPGVGTPYSSGTSLTPDAEVGKIVVTYYSTSGGGGMFGLSATVVPEPSSVLFVGLGALGFTASRRRK